jgi:hypothetical protein
MIPQVEKLLSISAAAAPQVAFPDLHRFDQIASERFVTDLTILLSQRNGLYAFESALHVFPGHSGPLERSIHEWNDRALWIDEYQGLADDCVFFAEDIFGMQFCADREGIHQIDAETGSREFLATTLQEWIDKILANYEYLTGYPLAHEWQSIHGPLPRGQRLVPKVPFVTQGAFEISNLYALDSVKAMRFRGYLAAQIRDLPDGAQIRFDITQL